MTTNPSSSLRVTLAPSRNDFAHRLRFSVLSSSTSDGVVATSASDRDGAVDLEDADALAGLPEREDAVLDVDAVV